VPPCTRPPFAFVEHGGADEYLAPSVGLAFLLPLAPLFFGLCRPLALLSR